MRDEAFNLLDENWIPVLYADGRFEHVGTVRALREAGEIRQIAASNPMDRVALLRFLLAVLLWCKSDLGDVDLAGLKDASGIPEEGMKKLQDNAAAFNLLGDGERFYQDAALKGGTPRPVADLLAEFPGADSVNHLHHVVHDGSYGFCPACCAMGILRLSVWAPANKYYPASVNPGSAAYAIAEKKNLFLTLVANLPKENLVNVSPPWLSATPPDSPDAIAFLAWRPRKLWLNDDDKPDICANCGNSSNLIRTVCNQAGWPTPVSDGQTFAKLVEAELKRLGYKPKGKDDPSKDFKKLLKNVALIRKCRMAELLQAVGVDPAKPHDTDEHEIARLFNDLVLQSKAKADDIKKLARKPTDEEKKQLADGDTKAKKFWDEDPLLLKDGEPLSLPGLGVDAGVRSSKFWRDAMRMRGARTGRVEAVGPVVNKFAFQDAAAVELPGPASQDRVHRTQDCSTKLGDLLKSVTPNPKREHPEIKTALVLLTPDSESCIRTGLNEAAAAPEDGAFLRTIYEPILEQAITATTPGSHLRRRAAMQAARDLLGKTIRRLTNTDNPSSTPPGDTEAAPAKTKRRRKKKQEGS